MKCGLDSLWADRIDLPLTIALLIGFAYLVDFISRAILLNLLVKVAKKTKVIWDDILVEQGVVVYACRIIAPVIIYASINTIDEEFSVGVVNIMRIVVSIYIVITILQLINSLLKSVYQFYDSKETDRKRPLKGLLQTGQVILWALGTIVIIGLIFDKSPLTLLGGIGASAAVLMLVFKDSILGLVSGVQLSAQDMLKVGDWIVVPKYGADGTVLEVTLNTVKVQNWDNTIVTLPPYALVSGAFQNWKGMEQGGGRRVKRHVNIDMTSVKFCTPEMIEKFKKIELLKGYLEETQKEIDEYNKANNVDTSIEVNGIHQTNLGVFRAYLNAYLAASPKVNHDMTFMVRQLQPTQDGIPIEIYFFSKIKSWVQYEGVQADVFDHVLSIVPMFELEIFQSPTGKDIVRAMSK